MTEPEKPKRRPRYLGKNPRLFHEKYKELQPDRYPDELAKILAGGRTPVGMHRPIMMREILDVLAPKPGDVVLDCTLGFGGHARELLMAVQPGGKLLGIDADPIELPKTEARLQSLGFPPDAVIVKRMNFAGIAGFLAEYAPEGVDVLLADLGLSSMQIDDPTRGFTYKGDGPLDMRMNPSGGKSATDLLSTIDASGLARIFTENADEPLAPQLAVAIVKAHRANPITTTRELAEVVQFAFDVHSKSRVETIDTTLRRVFQALRIAVNDEFRSLETLLRNLPACLKPGGRVAILSFHSGEDRRVKSAFKEGLQNGLYSHVSTEVIRVSGEEKHDNSRSSSAKLRFAVRSS